MQKFFSTEILQNQIKTLTSHKFWSDARVAEEARLESV